MAQIELNKIEYGVYHPMDITINLDRTINDEEKDFIKSMIQEFLSYEDDNIEFFIDGAGLYEVNILLHLLKADNIIDINNNLDGKIHFFINLDEYIGQGLEKITPHSSFDSQFFHFLNSDTFTDKYLRRSSTLRGRHIKI
ncbi:MAG: hypothetical protein GY870_14200 [archaeon]|nr:hypothetical protein [archaeon]